VGARAVIFDVMGTLFDLAPVRERLTQLGAPEGALEAWFGRMLHTSAVLTLVDEFHPFREIGRTTLLTTLAQLDVEPDQADEVLRALGQLDPYPDAAQAFDLLEEAGVPAVTLTNGGRQHTEMLLESAGLRSRVQQVLTVDEVGAFKPHPEPYHYVVRTLGLPTAALTLIAAHGWDVVGARAAGLSAIWIDRLERRWPFPTVEPPTASSLVEAVELVLARSA
jgi:2-haloacid dehalogenase